MFYKHRYNAGVPITCADCGEESFVKLATKNHARWYGSGHGWMNAGTGNDPHIVCPVCAYKRGMEMGFVSEGNEQLAKQIRENERDAMERWNKIGKYAVSGGTSFGVEVTE